MTETHASLSRKEIRQIFQRHRGAALALSKELGVSHTTMSLWLRGKTVSARIAEAAQTRAHELLELEGSINVA